MWRICDPRRLSLLLSLSTALPLAAQVEEPRPIVFGKNFYNREIQNGVYWRWMGDGQPDGPLPLEGALFLPNTRKDMTLSLSARLPTSKLDGLVHIRIVFNGALLDDFHYGVTNLDKTYVVPAARQSDDEQSEVTISLDKFFIPRVSESGSKDSRRLAFKLMRLAWTEVGAAAPTALFPAPADVVIGAPPVAAPRLRSLPAAPAAAESATPRSMGLWKILVPLGSVGFGLLFWLAYALRRRARVGATAARGDRSFL